MPVDLHKKEDINFAMKWEAWVQRHAPILLLLSLIILVLLVIALACAIMGVSAHSLTGTEANNFYYHLEELA
jgi:hypothetical protein